jgi:glycosyltransferase involved in cell wall biosynthesis
MVALEPILRHLTLFELPPPPAGKTGWPWTEETPALPAARSDGSAWPRITIVTPSYNQGQFIEETIRSVILQGYHDLEYIIIDGGSRDQSVEIIKQYEPWLTYWVSEQDRGQSHAINKGFDRSTGLILGWLNSDDVLLPNALATVAAALPRPEEPMLIAGKAEAREVSGIRIIWVVDRVPQTLPDVFSRYNIFFWTTVRVFYTAGIKPHRYPSRRPALCDGPRPLVAHGSTGPHHAHRAVSELDETTRRREDLARRPFPPVRRE